MTPTAKTAFERILALRELTKATGTKTTRAQNEVLQALSDADLTDVAVSLRTLAVLSGESK